MSRHTKLVPAIALAFASALAGCSPASEASPAHPSFGGEAVESTWQVPMRALAQPKVADGIAVVVVEAREDELDVVALDAATGEEKWRHPYSPGAEAATAPAIVRDGAGGKVVVFQRPPADLQMAPGMKLPLAAVDLDTGDLVSESEPHTVDGQLVECSDGHDACNSTYDVDEDQTMRFTVSNGKVAVSTKPEEKLPDDVPDTFHGGFYRIEGTPAKIGRVIDGEKTWQKSTTFLLPDTPGGHGFYTWDWRDEDGVLLLWLTDFSDAQHESYESGGTATLGLTDSRVIAVDQENGNVLWEDHGVEHWCGPSAGGTLAHTPLDDIDKEPNTRCRMTGASRQSADGPTEYTIDTYTAEGYDIQTGKTLWSQELPPHEGQRYTLADPDTSRPNVYMPDHAVVEIDSRPTLLSIESGETISVPEGEVFLCGERRDYKYTVPIDGRRTHTTDQLAFPCTHGGKPADQPITDAMLRQVAVPAGNDTYLVASKNELIGYQLKEPSTFLGIELPF